MKLLGDWNWYLPHWLRWLPNASLHKEPRPRELADYTRTRSRRSMSTDVRKFLERHEQASDRLNFDAVAESFADVFLSLHPNTTVTREQLLAALPARQRLT